MPHGACRANPAPMMSPRRRRVHNAVALFRSRRHGDKHGEAISAVMPAALPTSGKLSPTPIIGNERFMANVSKRKRAASDQPTRGPGITPIG
jgi:hypothetical protein